MSFKVSVIIPVFNADMYVEEAIKSALIQEEVEEVILIEDGHGESSYNICLNLSLKYKKVKLYTHPFNENKGAGASRNLGIEKANYNFIAFLDADDVFAENRFTHTRKKFEDIEVDAVYEAIGTISEDETLIKTYLSVGNNLITTLKYEVNDSELFEKLVINDIGSFSIIGLTLKTKVAKNILFNTTLVQCQDTDFIWTLALKYKIKAGNIVSPVSFRRLHNANRSVINSKEKIKSKIKLHMIWMEKPEYSSMSYRIKLKILKMYLSYQLQLIEKPFSFSKMVVQFLKFSTHRPDLILKTIKW